MNGSLWLPRLLVLVAFWGWACHPGPSERNASGEAIASQIQVTRVRLGVPEYGGIDARAAWQPMAEYLQRRLGVPVELRIAEPYSELPRLVAQQRVDIADLAPLVFVRMQREEPDLKPLVTEVVSGSPTYLGHLYVREDSPYQSLADLRGARIGYVDESSSSGYLFERDLMRSRGFDPDTFFSSSRFFQSHQAVLEAVKAGKIDVGAAIDVTSGWSGLLQRPTGLRVLAKTARIPNDCIVAREGFDPAATFAIKDALLSLHVGDPEARKILNALHLNGWVKADEARYERVREVLERESAARSRH